ncbi:MAG TPA: DUF4288 domain-containing protein [Flavisolibacter sp.]|nr:DUF4288 domain-containing protein [Flavisolibacter sp.]
MNWYLAKVIYRIICGNGEHTPQFDEQLRLISAFSADEAFIKASEIGFDEQETFYNEKRQLVRWEFINVSEIHPLNDLIDGAELYSRINEVDDAEAYTEIVHRKASWLRERQTEIIDLIQNN